MLVAELVIYSSPKLLINPRLTYLTNLANITLTFQPQLKEWWFP